MKHGAEVNPCSVCYLRPRTGLVWCRPCARSFTRECTSGTEAEIIIWAARRARRFAQRIRSRK